MGRYRLEIFGKLHGAWEESKDWVKPGYIEIYRAQQGWIRYLYGVRREILKDPNPVLVLPDIRPRNFVIGAAEDWARERGIRIEWVDPGPPTALARDKKEVDFEVLDCGWRVTALPGERPRHSNLPPLGRWQIELYHPKYRRSKIIHVAADGLARARQLRNPIRLGLALLQRAFLRWRRERRERRRRVSAKEAR